MKPESSLETETERSKVKSDIQTSVTDSDSDSDIVMSDSCKSSDQSSAKPGSDGNNHMKIIDKELTEPDGKLNLAKAEQFISGALDKGESKKEEKLSFEIKDSKLINKTELEQLVTQIEQDCQQETDGAEIQMAKKRCL